MASVTAAACEALEQGGGEARCPKGVITQRGREEGRVHKLPKLKLCTTLRIRGTIRRLTNGSGSGGGVGLGLNSTLNLRILSERPWATSENPYKPENCARKCGDMNSEVGMKSPLSTFTSRNTLFRDLSIKAVILVACIKASPIQQ
jgi:hypothetical protein